MVPAWSRIVSWLRSNAATKWRDAFHVLWGCRVPCRVRRLVGQRHEEGRSLGPDDALAFELAAAEHPPNRRRAHAEGDCRLSYGDALRRASLLRHATW
jgi:hypothetical protein